MSGINPPKVDECELPGAAAAEVSAEAVDRYLDLVLRASGSALRNYSMPTTLDAMRAVMRDAMRGGDVHVAVPESSAGPLRTDAAQRLAEHVLSMGMITEKGIRARELARAVLVSRDDLLQALWLIRHATSPQPDDGGHHENAFGLACAAIARATGATP